MLKRVKLLLFKNITTRQTVAKNAFWLTVSNVGGRFIRAIIIVYGARILGASGWGVFSYGVTLAAFLTPFTDVGLSQVLVRETAKESDPTYRKQILSTTLVLKLILLVLGIIIIVVIAPLFTTIEEAKSILPVIAFLLAFDTLREFGSAIIRANEKMEWEAALFFITNVAIVTAGFAFLAISATPMYFTLGYTVGTAIGALASFIALRKHFPRNITKYFSPQLLKSIFSSAWPLSIATLLGLLMLNTDILIIGWLLPAKEVGFYSAAYRIVQFFYILPGVLAASLFPTFSRLAMRDNAQMRSVLERSLTVVFILAFPLAAGGILLGPDIMGFLFGQEFLPGTSVFQILLLTLLVDFPMIVLANAAFAYNRPKILTVYASIGGFSNVLLDFLLIPPFGIAGCAIATLIAQILSNFYIWKKLREVNYFKVTARLPIVLAATAVMALAVVMLNITGAHVLLVIAISGIIYALALHFLKEPSVAEILAIIRSKN